MKLISWLVSFGFILSCVSSARADGFIVVDSPPAPLPSIPPPPFRPPPHPPFPIPRPLPPPYRPFVFAPLEVKYHRVEVSIHDQIATTRVEQEFYNPNPQVLEGTYLFPVPENATIKQFSLEIAGQQVEAELLDADQARKIYTDIVRKMKDPALMEYAGRSLFKVRIFPIEAQGTKHVSLSYTQVLKADDNLVNYVYPLNTEKFSARAIPEVRMHLELNSSRPLKNVFSPSHAIEVKRNGPTQADISYLAKDVKPDSDFQLWFSCENSELGANLLTCRGRDDDGFFLLLLSPPSREEARRIIPKDVVFVFDTSGSMAGAKISQAKKAFEFCVENLNADDRFEVISFATDVRALFNELQRASANQKKQAVDFIRDVRAIGGTAIDAALQAAIARHPHDPDRPFVLIFLTDGRPTIGETDEDKIMANLRSRTTAAAGPKAQTARIYCFGIGSDVNTHLLDQVSGQSQGYSQYVLADEDLELKLSSFFTKINAPVLTNLKLDFPTGIRADRFYPMPIPDLFKGSQLVIAGRYSGSAKGTLTLRGSANGQPQEFSFPVDFSKNEPSHDFIPRLWATRRIGFLLDEIRLHGDNPELRQEIVELARRYGIVTPYTAYLIIEDEDRRGIPAPQRSLPELERDTRLREDVKSAAHDWQHSRTGSSAVTSARFSSALKSAEVPAQAVLQGNSEAQRDLSVRTQQPATGRTSVKTVGLDANAQPWEIQAQNFYFVGGKNFFRHGDRWIDSQAQGASQSNRIRIAFASPEYFQLAKSKPQTAPWIALGIKVTFSLEDTIYEIE
jgi:Ca-activated chloride channel homolog